jgi:hypothetical protein
MIRYPTGFKDPPKLRVEKKDFMKGLNTLVSNTQIKPDELSMATDIQIIEDGKIQFPRMGQSYFGLEKGTRTTGIFGYYKSDGTNQLLRMSGTALQKYNTSTTDWDNVAGKAYTTGLNAEAVTAYDKLYICNGTDDLTEYGGTSVTVFTAIATPNAPTATRTGTTGTYTYSYKITAVTAVGETDASAAGTSDLNVSSLDTTNYMTVSWSAVTDAIGYNVYGRKGNSWKFIVYLEGNGSVSYVDKGTVSDSTLSNSMITPPESNNTGGPIGKYIELYKDTLFIAGDPSNPSRVYYSGGGDKISDFTIGSGGGFIDISKNDGQIVTNVKKYRNYLLIFKERSIYQFAFDTSGLPSVTQVSSSIGAIAPRSVIAVENDVHFLSERGWFTVGNVEQYSFDILRTNEISARVRTIIQNIDTAYIRNVSANYATKEGTNLIVISYTPSGSTTNSKALVFDRERLCWYEWTNVSANCWTNYVDSAGETHVLYGDDSGGYVKEILSGSDDFGSGITGKVRTSGTDFGKVGYKTLKVIDWELRNPTGSITVNIITDGVTTAKTIPISTISPSVNWGHYLFGKFLFGVSYGTGAASSQDENLLRTVKAINLLGRNFLLEYQNSSSGSFILLSESMTAKPKSDNFRQSDELITS